jgi:hypothetical protein
MIAIDTEAQNAMPNIGTLIIFQSDNGMDGWTPVKPEDVPAWVKDPDNLARLVDGEACQNTEQESGEKWYMAQRLPTAQDLEAYSMAAAKRVRRRAKLTMH